jgi:type IV pilus assembly protein PilA
MASPGAPRRRTGLAVTALVLSILSLCTAAGLLVGALTALVLGIVAAVRASKRPDEYAGMPMAITAIILAALSLLSLPMVAAIAIPSLLRARVSANESRAIGDLRSLISAQAAYQSANGGLYDTTECLAEPQTCIPNYPAAGPRFVDASLLSPEPQGGYRRTFHAGPAPEQLNPALQSRSSVTTFAYVAVPATMGRTGVRSFCGDHRGIICYSFAGGVNADGGECPPPPGCVVIE